MTKRGQEMQKTMSRRRAELDDEVISRLKRASKARTVALERYEAAIVNLDLEIRRAFDAGAPVLRIAEEAGIARDTAYAALRRTE